MTHHRPAGSPASAASTRLRLALRLSASLPRHQRGFTLIELLVVVVIIGILASIAGPSYVKAMDKTRSANIKSNVRSVQQSVETYASMYNGTVPGVTGWCVPPNDGTPTLVSAGLLPGGKLPASPWGGIQSSWIWPPPSNLPTMAQLEDQGAPASLPLPGLDLGEGMVKPNGPTMATDFGALIYTATSTGPGSVGTTYAIFGVGKRDKQAIVASSVSNVAR